MEAPFAPFVSASIWLRDIPAELANAVNLKASFALTALSVNSFMLLAVERNAVPVSASRSLAPLVIISKSIAFESAVNAALTANILAAKVA